MDRSLANGAFWILLTLSISLLSSYFAKLYGPSVLIATYTGLVIISITTAAKLIKLFFVVPGGVIVYSSSFLITDLLTEVYGERQAKIAVWSGLGAMLIFNFYSTLIVRFEYPSFWTNQQAFQSVLGLSARIAIAGATAFIISQLVDVHIFNYLKNKYDGYWFSLLIRNNVSTLISQLLDTIIFITIAFYGAFPIIPLIIGQYLVKAIIAIADTPFIYLSKYILKKDKTPYEYL